MKKVKIEIVNCDSKFYWYYDKVGEMLEAEISHFGKAMVVVKENTLSIDKKDFKLIQE